MKMPKVLQQLVSSPKYADKYSAEYARATKYFELLYPGTVPFDSTGKMILPEYDMTLDEFEKAQRQIETDFEEYKQDAEEDILEEYGEYFEKLGINFDINSYVVQDEFIVVKVLYPINIVIDRELIFYDLQIPEIRKRTKIWRWHSEYTESTCQECGAMDNAIFLSEDEIPQIPRHPNCKCYITEDTIDGSGNTISSKKYIEQEEGKASEMQISDNGLNKLKQLEGAVKIAGRHVIYDDATGRPIAPNAPLPRGATIGYGHLIKSSENFTGGLTERAATELLRQDVRTAQRAVQNSITANLTQNQYDALVMLAYNIGAQNFSESTVVKYINNPDFHSAVYPNLESAWLAWNKSGAQEMLGLSNRRRQEFEWFSK